MRRESGLTIIELLVFIVVAGMLAATAGVALNMVALKTPVGQRALVAQETAKQCMEYLAGQRASNGYATIACPSTSVPGFCTAPTGYTIGVDIACTTISDDANYKTITVTVGGAGNSTLTLLIAA